jgi:hypothetical protein
MLFSKLLLFSTLNTMFPLIFATANLINEVKKCHIAEMLYILHLQKNIAETTETFLGNTPTLKLLLYVPNIGQFWQYIVCTAELA